MRHYHIDIIVNEDDIRTIKEEFNNFIHEAGGFSLVIRPDNDDVVPSPELETVLRKMFFHFLMTINFGSFKNVN